MIRPSGILGAAGTIVLATIILGLMLWLTGHPSLVSWWNAEYLIGGFVALLFGAIILAFRSKENANANSQEKKVALASLAKGVGIVFGAVLLFLYVIAH